MSFHDEILSLVVERCPERIVVYDRSHKVVFLNVAARKFFSAYEIPEEIGALTRRIFESIAKKNTSEKFQGPICLHREIGPRRWRFRITYREEHPPLVCLFFSDETVSGCLDLNDVRQSYRLTRREVEVLRHLLDGATSEEISEDLVISVQSVKDHLTSIYKKCGVKGRFDLLRQFVKSPAP